MGHDITLAWRETRKAFGDCRNDGLAGLHGFLSMECRVDSSEHFAGIEWFLNEIDRTELHGSDRHRNVAVTRHDDDGKGYRLVAKIAQEGEAIFARHADVE